MSSIPNSAERPFSAVLGSILGNLQDIVRSEVKLAKTEVRDELSQLAQGVSWLAIGIISAFFALSFLLGAAFLALSTVVPQWAAALIVAGALAVVSGVSLVVRSSIVKKFSEQHSDLAAVRPEESTA